VGTRSGPLAAKPMNAGVLVLTPWIGAAGANSSM
jgi:hypothetical protein